MPNTVNKAGKGRGSVTVALPRYELVDKDGGVRGHFHSATIADAVAKEVWPDQEQDEDRTGRGWDIQVVGS